MRDNIILRQVRAKFVFKWVVGQLSDTIKLGFWENLSRSRACDKTM